MFRGINRAWMLERAVLKEAWLSILLPELLANFWQITFWRSIDKTGKA